MIRPGDQAFPDEYNAGLSVRDWFAGYALAGLLSGQVTPLSPEDCREVAKAAYAVADALIRHANGGGAE